MVLAASPDFSTSNTLRNNFNTSPLVSTYRPTKKSTTTTTTCPRNNSPKTPMAEPTSPRIGCMGQIRRCKPPSGRVVSGLLVQSKSSSLKSRAASPPPASGSGMGLRLDNMMRLQQGLSTLARVETVEGMDPPRPVERKKEVGERSSTSLWKRRCGTAGEGGGGGAGLRLPRPAREIGLS